MQVLAWTKEYVSVKPPSTGVTLVEPQIFYTSGEENSDAPRDEMEEHDTIQIIAQMSVSKTISL